MSKAKSHPYSNNNIYIKQVAYTVVEVKVISFMILPAADKGGHGTILKSNLCARPEMNVSFFSYTVLFFIVQDTFIKHLQKKVRSKANILQKLTSKTFGTGCIYLSIRISSTIVLYSRVFFKFNVS